MKNKFKGIRLSEKMITQIEQFALQEGLNFSSAVKNLLGKSLAKNTFVSASDLPDYEKRRLNYDIKCWFMLQEIIYKIAGNDSPEVLTNIQDKTIDHLNKHFYKKPEYQDS